MWKGEQGEDFREENERVKVWKKRREKGLIRTKRWMT